MRTRQDGGFADAGFTDDDHELAARDGEVQLRQDDVADSVALVGEAEAAYGDDRVHQARHRRSQLWRATKPVSNSP